MAKKKTEIDKLDIDEIIDEIEEEKDKEENLEKDKEEKKEEPPKEEKEEKPTPLFKNKKVIFIAIWIFLFIIICVTGFLAYKEKTKVIHVYSINIKINPEIIYLSKEKKEKVQKEKLYHTYNFNFQFAYEFNGINSKRILATQVTCLFKTKYEVDLDELYAYIKKNIENDFKKLIDGKFLEEISNYETKLSVIIQNNIVNAILKVCPDLDKKKLIKTINFVVYRIT